MDREKNDYKLFENNYYYINYALDHYLDYYIDNISN